MQRFFILATLLAAALSPAAAASDELTVAFLGDFLPAGSAADTVRTRGVGYLFDGVRPFLSTADAVVLNLETPLSNRGQAVQDKKYTFRAPLSVASALPGQKVLGVTLANNHILDFGYDALSDTFRALSEAGIPYAGAGPDAASAYSPATVRTEAGEFMLLAFSNTFPESYWAGKNRPGTAFGSPSAVARAVSRARKSSRAPLVVVFHWGEELMATPKDYQAELAHLAIDNGADLVVGHHPHVVQTVEVYRGSPILYSLGNFAFGSYSRSATGLMALARFGKDGRCVDVTVVPLDVDNNRVAFSPRPLSGLDGQRVFDPLVMGIDRLTRAERIWDGEKGVITPLGAGGVRSQLTGFPEPAPDSQVMLGDQRINPEEGPDPSNLGQETASTRVDPDPVGE